LGGGEGLRFEIAHALTARNIPFIFLTGYDPEVGSRRPGRCCAAAKARVVSEDRRGG
jgi:hypothetical protein